MQSFGKRLQLSDFAVTLFIGNDPAKRVAEQTEVNGNILTECKSWKLKKSENHEINRKIIKLNENKTIIR